MKSRWTKEELALPLFLIVVITLAVALAFVIRTRQDVSNPPRSTPPSAPTTPNPAPPPSDGSIDEATCKAAGGNWNPCGSACRGAPPDTMCIQVCKPYCECGGFAGFGCPAGTTCGQYEPKGAADAMGICE